MSKYKPLGPYLAAQPDHVRMSFDEIEAVIGATLPPVAASARAWWSNNASNNVMTKVWLAAGFKTEQVDIAGRRLVFRRAAPGLKTKQAEPSAEEPRAGRPLFGCMKGTVRLAPGLDLTAPAGAGWGAGD